MSNVPLGRSLSRLTRPEPDSDSDSDSDEPVVVLSDSDDDDDDGGGGSRATGGTTGKPRRPAGLDDELDLLLADDDEDDDGGGGGEVDLSMPSPPTVQTTAAGGPLKRNPPGSGSGGGGGDGGTGGAHAKRFRLEDDESTEHSSVVFATFDLTSATSKNSSDKAYMDTGDPLQRHFVAVCHKAGVDYNKCKFFKKDPSQSKDSDIEGATALASSEHRKSVGMLRLENGTHFVVLEARPPPLSAAGGGAAPAAPTRCGITIVVQRGDGKSVEVPCAEADTVGKAIEKFKALAGLPATAKVVLEFDDETLDLAHTLESYGIEDEFRLDAHVS